MTEHCHSHYETVMANHAKMKEAAYAASEWKQMLASQS
jgi:hypothetical protein